MASSVLTNGNMTGHQDGRCQMPSAQSSCCKPPKYREIGRIHAEAFRRGAWHVFCTYVAQPRREGDFWWIGDSISPDAGSHG